MKLETELQILSELASEPARTEYPPRETGAESLPSSDYTDPKIYEMEIEHVFRKSWIPVARVSEFATTGDFITLELAGDSLILIKNGDAILGFHNVCIHRGSVIMRTERGCVECLRCPYHDFVYQLNGKLKSTPLPESFRAWGLPDDARLAPVRTSVWGGFVWIALDPSVPELLQYLGELAGDLHNWQLDTMELKERTISEELFNWKIGVEAFLESLHVPSIHASSVHPVADYRSASIAQIGEHSRMAIAFRSAKAYFSDGPFGRAARAAGVANIPTLNRVQQISNLSYLLFPAVIFNFLPNHFAMFRIQPVSPSKSRFIYELYAPAATSNTATDYYNSLKPGYQKLVSEDLANLPWIQRGAVDQTFTNLQICYHERRIVHFRNSIRARIANARPDIKKTVRE